MSEADPPDYPIGFGRPPRKSRFQPGQSGNPRGRPKSARNFATAFASELNDAVTVTEDGKRRRITKRQVIAKQLVNKAAAGDLRAIPLVLGEERLREQGHLPDVSAIFETEADQSVLANIIKRIRATESEPASLDRGERGAFGAR